MRVTSNLLINKFSRNLNSSATNLDTINDQVTTGMKFSKASQDTSGALKAFKIRRSLARVEQYQNNVRDVQGVLDQTETTLMGIHEVLKQAKESLVQGANGTLSETNRQTIANIFTNLQDQILKLANTNFAGKYILGGPNTTASPFTVDGGILYYNGENMNNDLISKEEVFVDLGLGLSFDASGAAQSHTAVSVSTPGSVVLGSGVDANGIPDNIYNLFSNIIASLENNDLSKIEQQIQKLSNKSDDIMVQVAGIGERNKFVEFLDDRLSTDKLNLRKKQNAVESIDQAQAIVDYKVTEMAYKAALQMGSKIIQTSLLDFLR